ncbi:hypothetical protein PG988_000511, partial [Apiospora saccharicola]
RNHVVARYQLLAHCVSPTRLGHQSPCPEPRRSLQAQTVPFDHGFQGGRCHLDRLEAHDSDDNDDCHQAATRRDETRRHLRLLHNKRYLLNHRLQGRHTRARPRRIGPAPPRRSPATDDKDQSINWSSSYHGLGTSTFGPEVATVLQAPLDADDIEVKPDGIIYLPEIKYRRVLNSAFGPGGWGLAPRGDLVVQDRLVSRDYALIVHGRFVGQARGEQQYFSEDGISTAAEGCKSNALMRCCKDLGIASELWDPRFIRKFIRSHAQQLWVEHVVTKKKKQIWLRKDDEVRYPFKKTT